MKLISSISETGLDIFEERRLYVHRTISLTSRPNSVTPFFFENPFTNYSTLAGVTYYLIYKASVAASNTDEFINDPRNPRFKNGGKYIDLSKKEEAH